MSKNREERLSKCLMQTNCVLLQWKFNDINKAFDALKEIASELPRTTIIEDSNNYWQGLCRSLIFRFPDDLKILKVTKENIIQIKSSSRYGVSDLGVNQKRLKKIYNELIKKEVR